MSTSSVLSGLTGWRNAFIALGLTGLSALGTVATAQQQSAPSTAADTIKVSLNGLDLATAEGIRLAHERLHLAARRVCAKVKSSADMSTTLTYLTCIDAAMANSLAQVDVLARARTAQRLAHNQE